MSGVRSFDPNVDAGEHRNLANLLATTRKKENVGGMHRSQMALSGKSGMKSSVSFKTPFNAGKSENLGKGSQTTIKPSQSNFQRRALGEKTPLPNRDLYSTLTPLPRSASKKTAGKTPLPSLLDVVNGNTPTQPPSTGRKKARTPNSVSKAYKTPVTKGDHWNVSDVSIELGSSLEELAEEDVDDYSDVEYMPPTAVVPLYEPPFELPDYKEVGEKLLMAAYSFPVNDLPTFNEDFDADNLLKDSGWSPNGNVGLTLPDLERDDPYLKTLASFKPPAEQLPPRAQARGPTARTGGLPASSTTRSSLFSHTKSSSVPIGKVVPSRATSSSTIRPIQSRPATVAARPSRLAATNSRLTVGASASAQSVRTLSTRSSVPNLSAKSAATQSKGKLNGQTASEIRETKASLTRAMARIKHIGGEAAVMLEKEKAKAKTNSGSKAGTVRSNLGSNRPVNKVTVKTTTKAAGVDAFVLQLDDLSIDGDDFRFQL